jgi:hypothetical protein
MLPKKLKLNKKANEIINMLPQKIKKNKICIFLPTTCPGNTRPKFGIEEIIGVYKLYELH